MSDLVNDLRCMRGDSRPDWMARITKRAADEIERLERELADMHQMRDDACTGIEKLNLRLSHVTRDRDNLLQITHDYEERARKDDAYAERIATLATRWLDLYEYSMESREAAAETFRSGAISAVAKELRAALATNPAIPEPSASTVAPAGPTESALKSSHPEVNEIGSSRGDQMKVTDEIVNRFLSWPFPKDFAPDGGIGFTPLAHSWPTGTNLLMAHQARAMLEHVLDVHSQGSAQEGK